MNIGQLKTAIRKAKVVYVFEPVTEGYVQVVKSNYILLLSELSNDCTINDMISPDRLYPDLYIN